jgi:hypothetical protein
MRAILAILGLLLSAKGSSQTVIGFGKTNSGAALTSLTYSIGGISTVNARYEGITEGSAFFNSTFVTGRITLSDGQIFDSISVRLDLLDNTLHYMSSEGQELIVNTPIKTVLLYDSASQKNIRFDHSDFITPAIEKAWYQLLDSGAVILYKRHFKSMRENRAYNSATLEQYITTTYGYFILINTVFTQVKKIKLLPDMLQHKRTELLEYINSNNLTGKSDKDYLALVGYYNSLVKK